MIGCYRVWFEPSANNNRTKTRAATAPHHHAHQQRLHRAPASRAAAKPAASETDPPAAAESTPEALMTRSVHPRRRPQAVAVQTFHSRKANFETGFPLDRVQGLKPGRFQAMGQALDSTCLQPHHAHLPRQRVPPAVAAK
jgi:hypothetical protein